MESQINFIQASRWLTEVLIGFMVSPGWLCPIQDFIDHNCESFEQTEENKLKYTSIFIEYCQMIEGMLQNISTELSIGEGILVGIIDEGLRNKKISFYFEYILATVDFLIFKNIMVKRNIEIEVEIVKKQKKKNHSNRKKQEIEDLELALALSMICKQEYETHRIDKKIKEDEELRRALEESSNEYIEEMQRQKMRILKEIEDAEEELRRKELRKSQGNAESQEAALKLRKELENTRERFEEEEKKQRSEMENLEKLREMKKNIEMEREKRNKIRKEEEDLLIQKKIERKKMEDSMGISGGKKKVVIIEEEKEEVSISSDLIEEEGNESAEQRKERLKDQRDLVINKMKHDRYEQLVEHMSKGGADFTYKPEQVSLLEANKRKRILDKLREGGHLPFNN